MTYRSKALRDTCKGQPCIRCGAHDETAVPAHYTGIRRHQFGGGLGHKPTDAAIADLCRRCHAEFDQYQNENGTSRSEEFLFYIVLTWDRRCKLGQVEIT